jgi:hypothetical protein
VLFERVNRLAFDLRRLLILPGLVLLAAGLAGEICAHTPSETFLTLSLSGTNLAGQWDVARLDLQQGLGPDPAALKTFSAEEVQRLEEALALDTIARLELKADARELALAVTDYLPITRDGREYVRVAFAASGLTQPPAVLELNARVLFAIDPNMHGLLLLRHDGNTETSVFNAQNPAARFTLRLPADRWGQWWTFVREGVGHIWMGFDHILFLLSLLLPAVLRREGAGWHGVERFQPAFINVVKIVTAFTVAHSITLSLAALQVVSLPSRLVESVIAASVALVALNNLWPMFGDKSWLVAFGFGLMHGFGFASVLGEFGLRHETLALALVGFNVGVELGQLAIVAVFLPLAFALRQSWFYRTVTFKFGSAVVVVIATAWMVERIFALRVLPFGHG